MHLCIMHTAPQRRSMLAEYMHYTHLFRSTLTCMCVFWNILQHIHIYEYDISFLFLIFICTLNLYCEYICEGFSIENQLKINNTEHTHTHISVLQTQSKNKTNATAYYIYVKPIVDNRGDAVAWKQYNYTTIIPYIRIMQTEKTTIYECVMYKTIHKKHACLRSSITDTSRHSHTHATHTHIQTPTL